jgi:tRNA modification GTPase
MARLLTTETIVAIASPAGASARVVIRLSGPEAHTLTDSVFKSGSDKRVGALRSFRRYSGTIQLSGPPAWPEVPAAAYVFKKPRSYTCEDMVELHTLGSPPLISALLRQLQQAGARQAGAGEFTRRAFLNGRVDLTQAEAVLAMTSGEQRTQVRLAARTLRGGLSEQIDLVKDQLIELSAYVEAGIDFSEDEIDLLPVEDACRRLTESRAALLGLKERVARFQIHRSDAVIALRGNANVGKSTLLNRLIGKDRAITSDQAGTTRDVIGVPCQIGPFKVRLLDVAGTKESTNVIEEKALDHARSAIANADLVIHLYTLSDANDLEAPEHGDEILVLNKIDQVSAARPQSPADHLAISALQGDGVEKLITVIEARLKSLFAVDEKLEGRDFVATTRQLGLIDECSSAIDLALSTMRNLGEERWELAMVDIRGALDALGEITGAVATDDILDAIFGRFCIGK